MNLDSQHLMVKTNKKSTWVPIGSWCAIFEQLLCLIKYMLIKLARNIFILDKHISIFGSVISFCVPNPTSIYLIKLLQYIEFWLNHLNVIEAWTLAEQPFTNQHLVFCWQYDYSLFLRALYYCFYLVLIL